MISFSYKELAGKSAVEAGYSIICHKCGNRHLLQGGTDSNTGQPNDFLLFFLCGESMLLGAVKGKLVKGSDPIAPGE